MDIVDQLKRARQELVADKNYGGWYARKTLRQIGFANLQAPDPKLSPAETASFRLARIISRRLTNPNSKF